MQQLMLKLRNYQMRNAFGPPEFYLQEADYYIWLAAKSAAFHAKGKMTQRVKMTNKVKQVPREQM